MISTGWLVAVADQIKNSREAIAKLKMGEVVMLTGIVRKQSLIAREAGVDHDCRSISIGKAGVVRTLQTRQGKKVMVGDGHDAPALAQAEVGIAFIGSGNRCG